MARDRCPRQAGLSRGRLEGCDFEDVFGYTWGRNILGCGRAAVDASFEHCLGAVKG